MNRSLLSTVLFLAPIWAGLEAQTFDSSANATFKGAYYVRQLLFSNIDPATGAVGRARSLLGTATLDGNGNYSITGTMRDSDPQASLLAQPFIFTGTYKISSNGLAKMQNPLEPGQTINGGVGLGSFVGSTTESTFEDMFVMIPASTGLVSNSALQGSYRMGFLDFPQRAIPGVRDAYFTLTTSGNGSLNGIVVNGSAADQGNSNLIQAIGGGTYALSGRGSGTIIFPAGQNVVANQIVTGTKNLFLSADGNILLGGSLNGFDMLVGVRAPEGLNTGIFGTYYTAGMDVDNDHPDSPVTDAFYGSVRGTGTGLNLWHERLNSFDTQTYDHTFASTVTLDLTAGATKGTDHYDVGVNGKAFVLVGRGSQYTLALGLHADVFQGSGLYIDPLGIVSVSSLSPVTNSIAPGEIVTINGSGFSASVANADTLPLPTLLAGTSVMVNGRPAPIESVAPTQITMVVPSNTPEDYVTFQVTSNGVTSNAVTLYANNSAPGVLTLNGSGSGPAAVLHTNGTLVNEANPAKPGEALEIFLTGLGEVTPPVPDGVASPSFPLSRVTRPLSVYIAGQPTFVGFAALAPGFVGVYESYVLISPSLSGGNQLLAIDTPDAFTQQATIFIAGPSGGAVRADSVQESPEAVRAGGEVGIQQNSTASAGEGSRREAGVNRGPVSQSALKRTR